MNVLLLALALAAPPNSDANTFVVVSTADERAAAKLVRFTPDLTATINTRLGETTVKDVIGLRRASRVLPSFPTGPHLITANGERIAGELLGGGASLRFKPAILAGKEEEAWLVPLSAASAVWFTDLPADTPLESARYTWVVGVKNRDVIRTRNGDTERGILVGLGPKAASPTIQFRPETGEARAVAAKDLAAIVFNPILVKPRKPKGAYVRVVLTDGSRLDLTKPTIADGMLKGDALFGHAIELPLDAVVSLDVLQGKAVYLSDLKPSKVDASAFLGVAWPWTADRTVHGTPLRLTGPAGDSTYDKGLGTHPRTVLTYDLAGKYRRFEASVGFDPDAGGRGQAAIRVLVDGKPQTIPRIGTLTAGEATAFRVNVEGAKELVLEVGFGPTGSIQADVNWAEARLIE